MPKKPVFVARYIYREKAIHAFTLVELAIVLIIVGFIIAGINAGVSLVQSAKLNSVIIEIRDINAAYLNFRSRYNNNPGDMPNAFQYFGTPCGNNDNGLALSCNGNGNRTIDSIFLQNGPFEDLKFWLHLSLSGILSKQSFTGVPTAGRQTAGVNTYKPSYGNGSAFWARWLGTGNAYSLSGQYNAIEWGGYSAGWMMHIDPIVTPLDAYSIDQKIDDGLADKGLVIAGRGDINQGTANSCVTAWFTTSSASYVLTDKTISCRVQFLLDTPG